MAEERVRYSDSDLAEFKQVILKKLEQARADYELLRENITHSGDNDTQDTSPTFKVLEEGAATLSKEESERLAVHQSKFIRNLEMALVRIENKTYGVCKTTGKLIPKDKAMRMFMFKRSYQVQHINGLTFDFLYDMAKKLAEADALMLVGGGAKGNEPLVMSNGGTPYRAFLEGRVNGESYALILRLTNLELKEIPTK